MVKETPRKIIYINSLINFGSGKSVTFIATLMGNFHKQTWESPKMGGEEWGTGRGVRAPLVMRWIMQKIHRYYTFGSLIVEIAHILRPCWLMIMEIQFDVYLIVSNDLTRLFFILLARYLRYLKLEIKLAFFRSESRISICFLN